MAGIEYMWDVKEKSKQAFSGSTKRMYFEEWLRMATKTKDLCMMRKLIEDENVDPNAEDLNGTTSIHIAAEQSDATTLLFFLSLNTKINVNVQDNTEVHWEKVLRPNFSININAQDKFGKTPLIIAISHGCEEVVRILLAQPNLDVNMADMAGHTPLMEACYPGGETIVSMLLGHEHIQVNKADFYYEETALMFAVNELSPELVRLLLTRDDINVNAQDKDRCTALMYSCMNGNTEIVRILLEHKDIDINLIREFENKKEWEFKVLQNPFKVIKQNRNALKLACENSPAEVEDNPADVISLLLQREELQTSACNIEAVVHFITRRHIDIKDKRAMRAVIDEAVSKNLMDIARWLLKIEGYLFRAVSLGPLRRRYIKRVKN